MILLLLNCYKTKNNRIATEKRRQWVWPWLYDDVTSTQLDRSDTIQNVGHDSFEHVQNDRGLSRPMPNCRSPTVRPVMATPSRKCYICITVYHDFLNRGRSGRKIVSYSVAEALTSTKHCLRSACELSCM